ncbi:Aste57867_8488 [Aphanomyces stellatus]|uniref:Aste57867_8488 protein n=1 Tax=Aphanomyces stellatus TaxID=120398 RepID=A0A485KKE8_9STRA|nr:hypothetical protein As57867_008456 [Aphanomyces stellatus]VFT85374.1 Aste57867_8488 [Aphanomyces stellatus]
MSNLEDANFVKRYKAIYDTNPTAETAPDVPGRVKQPLDKYGLTWNNLPNLAKLAIVWDSGFVIANVGGVDTWLNVTVAPLQCAIDTSNKTQFALSSVWAQDALKADDIPVPRAFMHADGRHKGPSIHGLPQGSDTEVVKYYPEPTSHCQTWGIASGMIIPCGHVGQNTSNKNTFDPKPSSDMEMWLKEMANPKTNNLALTAGMPFAAVILLAVASAPIGFASLHGNVWTETQHNVPLPAKWHTPFVRNCARTI